MCQQCRARITINEDDLRTYYKENGARLAGVQQERRASHILINAPKTMPAAEREAAKAKANELLAQVKAEPARLCQRRQNPFARPRVCPPGRRFGLFRPWCDGARV